MINTKRLPPPEPTVDDLVYMVETGETDAVQLAHRAKMSATQIEKRLRTAGHHSTIAKIKGLKPHRKSRAKVQ